MHPAFSILFFTTLSGAAQGLTVALALAMLVGVPMADTYVLSTLALAEGLLVAGLAASFLHLGHKMRAWRAVLMWRTSWMSREVIVLPAFIGLVAVWWLALARDMFMGWDTPWVRAMPLVIIVGAAVLWYCTAMIYACLRFIQEWAHPITVANFVLIGMSSGLVLACALAASSGQTVATAVMGPWALFFTALAALVRRYSLRRNAAIKHQSTLQSATGIHAAQLVQKSMGMSAGAFNTREFFHGASQFALHNVRRFFLLFLFIVPALLLLYGMGMSQSAVSANGSVPVWPWVLAAICQAPALIAERWYFFAQAKHPQNLYYQTVG